MTHDAIRTSILLREIFASGRNRVAFFLGAGCPVSVRVPTATGDEALIPDVAGLTAHVLQDLATSHAALAGKLANYAAATHLDVSNIEAVLGRVRAIVALVKDAEFPPFNAGELGVIHDHICRVISTRVRRDLPSGENGYRGIRTWVKGTARDHPVEIFTLNYDLLVEQALEESKITFFDGFTGSKSPFFDVTAIEREDLPPTWMRLWKLHGSINWKDVDGSVVRKTEELVDCNALIHPSHQKYDQSRKLPYLALIDRLKRYLRRPSASMIVCGYSFRDIHINDVIEEALEQNPTAAVFSFHFGSLHGYPEAIALAQRQSNLSLLGEDKGVIRTKVGSWELDPTADRRVTGRIFGSVLPGAATWGGGSMRFALGDFASFGDFLLEMTGEIGSSKGA